MLSRLTVFGGSGATRELGRARFGRLLDGVLPEDRFDRQPLVGGDGRLLLCADLRIDNRAEVAEALGLSADISAVGDSELLLKAWGKWQLGCLDRLLGDLAFAVWDDRAQRLTLARSASSLKALFYHRGPAFAAFASMPAAIRVLEGVPREPDLGEAAAIIAGLPGRGTATVFSGVRSVRHGHAVEIERGGEREIRHWHPEAVERRGLPLGAAAEAMRAELDRAVAAQLRRSSGGVACQLSSGRDSSAVLGSAALALARAGEELVALTGRPNAEFTGPHLPQRLSDEGPLAALTAARYPNVAHVSCRSRRRDIVAELRRVSAIHFRPLTNPSSHHWTSEVDDEAQRRGAKVMLIGSTGNFSISAGGPSHLTDLLRSGGPLAWFARARSVAGLSPAGWRNIGKITLGPLLPRPLFAGLLRASGRNPDQGMDLPMLRQPHRAAAEQQLRAELADHRPPRDYRKFRCEMLLLRDNADKMSLALSGLDVRDPTADRRLVELCLSFPPEHLVAPRFAPPPVYAAAFGERIPQEVLHNRRRGIQGADWFMMFDRAQLERAFGEYRLSPAVSELLDLAEVDRLIETWPERGPSDWPTIALYRYQLLGALAVAQYLSGHFPD